ncbi:hypothetical protein ACWFRK_15150 [Streptomyces sp. NPDC055157]
MCATTRTTIADHESLTLGAEFVHDTGPRDTNRAVAAHESPVGERIWRAIHANTHPANSRATSAETLPTRPWFTLRRTAPTGSYTSAGHPHPTAGYVGVFGMRNRGLTIPGSASRFLAAHWYID